MLSSRCNGYGIKHVIKKSLVQLLVILSLGRHVCTQNNYVFHKQCQKIAQGACYENRLWLPEKCNVFLHDVNMINDSQKKFYKHASVTVTKQLCNWEDHCGLGRK